MILSTALDELRDVLDDSNNSKFPDQTKVRTLNRVVRGLFRQIGENRQDFEGFTMALSSTAAVQVLNNVWEWRLPTWVMHVLEIVQRDGDPTVLSTFSPYVWTGATNVRMGTPIPKYVENPLQPHWGWQGNHTIRLYGFTTVPNILLRVVVRPPTLLQFTVEAAHSSASKLYVPKQPTLGALEKEEGSYVNAEFQVVQTNSETSTNLGQMRRVVYSTAGANVGGDLVTECTMEAAWSAALANGDVLESVLCIPDEHCRYVILETAMACFQRKPNVQAMKLIGMEIMRENKSFLDFATAPRDKRGPTYVQRGGRRPYLTWSDRNRLPPY